MLDDAGLLTTRSSSADRPRRAVLGARAPGARLRGRGRGERRDRVLLGADAAAARVDLFPTHAVDLVPTTLDALASSTTPDDPTLSGHHRRRRPAGGPVRDVDRAPRRGPVGDRGRLEARMRGPATSPCTTAPPTRPSRSTCTRPTTRRSCPGPLLPRIRAAEALDPAFTPGSGRPTSPLSGTRATAGCRA